MGEKELTLEEAFAQLDDVIKALESRETSLEDSFLRYQEGMQLVKQCSEKIDTVEKKMILLNDDGEEHEF